MLVISSNGDFSPTDLDLRGGEGLYMAQGNQKGTMDPKELSLGQFLLKFTNL